MGIYLVLSPIQADRLPEIVISTGSRRRGGAGGGGQGIRVTAARVWSLPIFPLSRFQCGIQKPDSAFSAHRRKRERNSPNRAPVCECIPHLRPRADPCGPSGVALRASQPDAARQAHFSANGPPRPSWAQNAENHITKRTSASIHAGATRFYAQ